MWQWGSCVAVFSLLFLLHFHVLKSSILQECRKENDNVMKAISYTSVVADPKNLWAVGSDKKLRVSLVVDF